MPTHHARLTIILMILAVAALTGCASTDPVTSTLTYHPNGGAGTPPSDTSTYSVGASAVILEPGALTRSGYTFIGWNTDADGSGTTYQPGSTITVGTTDIILYATWRLRPSIAADVYHSAALLSDGSLYTWGYNFSGQLGDGTTTDRSTPTRVPAFAPDGASVTAVAVGTLHTAALLSDGTLYAWGYNVAGQLGDGTTTDRATPTRVPDFPPTGTSVTSIATGTLHTAALLSDGTLYTWGSNFYGQLGDGTTTATSSPTRVPDFPPAGTVVSALRTGAWYTMALLSDGTLYAWGHNLYGQLGDGTTTSKSSPTLVADIGSPSATIMTIAAGAEHVAVLLSDGTLYTWGNNLDGQLGNGTTTIAATPSLVPGFPPSGTTITGVDAGGRHTTALLSDGTLATWGNNLHGQLGDGTTTNRSAPSLVPAFGRSGIAAITTGGDHTAALLDDGTLYAWGYNDFGQLGDGTTTDRTTPTLVIGPFRLMALED
jgi:uncharacterized repeat protein (TIGR02543 family)